MEAFPLAMTWRGRSGRTGAPLLAPQIWVLEERYSGETAVSKLSRLRAAMKEQKATVHLLSSLDDIAWLLNIRKQSEDGNLLPLAIC